MSLHGLLKHMTKKGIMTFRRYGANGWSHLYMRSLAHDAAHYVQANRAQRSCKSFSQCTMSDMASAASAKAREPDGLCD
jgi:hypothetical protein